MSMILLLTMAGGVLAGIDMPASDGLPNARPPLEASDSLGLPRLKTSSEKTRDVTHWRQAIFFEFGPALINTASGGHLPQPFLGLRSVWRPRERWTLSAGYGLTLVKEGTPIAEYTNSLHRLYVRGDAVWGTKKRQYYVGMGPALAVLTARVRAEDAAHLGALWGPGIVFGTGLRMVRELPAAVEFGGQVHQGRWDFLISVMLGWAK